MERKPEKKRLTVAEAKARDERLTVAGIIVERPGKSTITLAGTKPSAQGDALRRDDGEGSGVVE